MRILALWLTTLLLVSACGSKRFAVKNGDLIFQDLDCSLCNAIEQATTGYRNRPVSHMGIIIKTDTGTYVLEAYDRVRLTPLDTFLARSNKIMIGRLKKPYRKSIPQAIRNGLKKQGLPYDEVFRLHNGKYYCSELIHDMFNETGENPFHIYPMNFRNLQTGRFDSIWINYFNKLNTPIPQDSLGCNPAEYSRNNAVKIIYRNY